MITINIIGGLGNQMFQYAFGYAVSRENKTLLSLDISGLDACKLRKYELNLFHIEQNIQIKTKHANLLKKVNSTKNTFLDKAYSRVLRYLLKFSDFYYQEKKEFFFDKQVFKLKADTYYYGYWQNEKYFKKYRDEILKIFYLKRIHSKTKKYKHKIVNSESVSIHIRRGDYVTNLKTNTIHGTCEINYYKRAIKEINKIKKNIKFFIFSDDLDWAKDNFKFVNSRVFVELDENIPDHEEMFLMSQCKHNIIANSSFSWWGAWLNQNPNKKVIAPRKWLKNSKLNTDDLIPKSWLQL
jgi:hypothetical protein